MLLLEECLEDIAKFVSMSIGSMEGKIQVGALLIQWGNTSMTIPAGSNVADKKIQFPIPYSENPAVFGQCTFSTDYPDLFNITVNTISTSGFSMGFRNNHATKYTIPAVWIAIGKV